MKIVVRISYAFSCFLVLLFSPVFAMASPYGRPSEVDLNKAEVIFVGNAVEVVGGKCLKINLLFLIKGEFGGRDLLCAVGEYEKEFDIDFLLKRKEVIFFAKKNGKIYLPYFHYNSLAYLDVNNCVGMPGVFNEKNDNYIVEGFQDFVGRFNVKKIPKKFISNGPCKKWSY